MKVRGTHGWWSFPLWIGSGESHGPIQGHPCTRGTVPNPESDVDGETESFAARISLSICIVQSSAGKYGTWTDKLSGTVHCDLRTSNILLMLVAVRKLLPAETLGVRVGDGSRRSSPGQLGSGSGSKREKGDKNVLMFGVVGDGVGDGVDDEDDDDASLKKARNRWWSSAVAVGERIIGRLILLYERGRNAGGGPLEDLGCSECTGGLNTREGRSGRAEGSCSGASTDAGIGEITVGAREA